MDSNDEQYKPKEEKPEEIKEEPAKSQSVEEPGEPDHEKYKPEDARAEKEETPQENVDEPVCDQSVENSGETPSGAEDEKFDEPESEPEEALYPEFEVSGSAKIATFFAAVRDVMLSPVEFFSQLNLKNGIGYPLAFGVIVYFINSLGSVVFSLIEMGLGINFGFPEQVFASALAAFLTPVFSLFIAPIAILLLAIIYHVLLMIFKFDSAGFEGTLRVVCYSSAPLVLGVIPFCGGVVGFLWSIIAIVVGFQLVCKMTTGWAIFIYLIPLILFCSCLGMVIGFVGLTAFMAILPEINHLEVFLQEV